MVDDRVVTMSSQGYKNLVNPKDGKGFHWTTDIDQELPVRMRASGPGSERPLTLCQLFEKAVKSGGDRPAMFVERGGNYINWTWTQYDRESRQFAKALSHLNVTNRAGICIMGFNSPEWAVACVGGILYEAVVTGVYITNEPSACLYQATHCDAEVIVVETLDHLKRFTANLDKLPRVKAFVVWGEEQLPDEFRGSQYFLWKDFLKLGSSIGDEVI